MEQRIRGDRPRPVRQEGGSLYGVWTGPKATTGLAWYCGEIATPQRLKWPIIQSSAKPDRSCVG
jgi:hypothetical protein